METETRAAPALELPPLTPGARRILDAAAELFYRHGIHAVGVDAIAARSGVTKRTLYDRFGSKDRLVAVYLILRHATWWRRMEQRLAQARGSLALAFFDSYAHDSEPSDRGCAFINAAAELSPEHPAFRVIREHKRAVVDRLADLLAPELEETADARAAAQEMFLLLEGALAHRGIDGDDRLVERARAAARRMVASGPSR